MAGSVEKRAFGKTGQQVSVVGLGGGGLSKHSFADGVATVQRALELGVTYFDTSPMYGNGVSQAILGQALQGRTEPHVLATKIGYLDKPRSPDALRAQLAENLRQLRRGHIDVLQVHEADYHHWWSDDVSHDGRLMPDVDYDFASAPVMQVLQEAKDKGQCRWIGITANTADNLARVLQHVRVDASLVAYNYDAIRRGVRRHIMPVAGEKKVAVILGGVFQAGFLTEIRSEWLKDPSSWMTGEIRSRIQQLWALQQECGLSLVSLTLRYLVADPAITTMLVGAATPNEIEQSVAAVQQGPLPSDLHQAVEELGQP